MASSIATIKLLQQLLKRSYRQNKTFDKYQVNFLRELQSTLSEQAEVELYNECYEQLDNIPNDLDERLSDGRLIVTQSQLQLQKTETLSSTIQNKIKETQQITQPYSISDHHVELTELIKIYQRAVIELSQKTAQPVSDNHLDIVAISEELQLLLLDLDVGELYVKKLEHIRFIISTETDPSKFPQHCLNIIAIVIESTQEERNSSRHFLYTLNDSLTQFYLNFSQTLKTTEHEFDEQQKCLLSIQKQSKRLKTQTQTAQDLISLRQHIVEYVTGIEQLIENTEKQLEEKSREKFQGMVRQIKELQAETQNYQKTLKQQNKQLHIDFLTKIPNRAAWTERFETEMTRFKRHHNPLNIAIVEIDQFKTINDNFGHLAGDKVLNVIAQTLQKSIRNTDYIARYSGEEFVLLLPDISEQQADHVLHKLCERIMNIPFKFKRENVSISISIGFTKLSTFDYDDSAFERAYHALNQAKNNGKNQIMYLGYGAESLSV